MDVRKTNVPLMLFFVALFAISGAVWQVAAWQASISAAMDRNSKAIDSLASITDQTSRALREELKLVWTRRDHDEFVEVLKALNPGVKFKIPETTADPAAGKR